MSDQTSVLLRSAADRTVPPDAFDLDSVVRGGRRRVRRRRAAAVGVVGALAAGAIGVAPVVLSHGEVPVGPAGTGVAVAAADGEAVRIAVSDALRGTALEGEVVGRPSALRDDGGGQVGWSVGAGGELSVQVLAGGNLDAFFLDGGLEAYCRARGGCVTAQVGDVELIRVEDAREERVVGDDAWKGLVPGFQVMRKVVVVQPGDAGVIATVEAAVPGSRADAEGRLRLDFEELERIALDPALRVAP